MPNRAKDDFLRAIIEEEVEPAVSSLREREVNLEQLPPSLTETRLKSHQRGFNPRRPRTKSFTSASIIRQWQQRAKFDPSELDTVSVIKSVNPNAKWESSLPEDNHHGTHQQQSNRFDRRRPLPDSRAAIMENKTKSRKDSRQLSPVPDTFVDEFEQSDEEYERQKRRKTEAQPPTSFLDSYTQQNRKDRKSSKKASKMTISDVSQLTKSRTISSSRITMPTNSKGKSHLRKMEGAQITAGATELRTDYQPTSRGSHMLLSILDRHSNDSISSGGPNHANKAPMHDGSRAQRSTLLHTLHNDGSPAITTISAGELSHHTDYIAQSPNESDSNARSNLQQRVKLLQEKLRNFKPRLPAAPIKMEDRVMMARTKIQQHRRSQTGALADSKSVVDKEQLLVQTADKAAKGYIQARQQSKQAWQATTSFRQNDDIGLRQSRKLRASGSNHRNHEDMYATHNDDAEDLAQTRKLRTSHHRNYEDMYATHNDDAEHLRQSHKVRAAGHRHHEDMFTTDEELIQRRKLRPSDHRHHEDMYETHNNDDAHLSQSRKLRAFDHRHHEGMYNTGVDEDPAFQFVDLTNINSSTTMIDAWASSSTTKKSPNQWTFHQFLNNPL